MYTVLYIYNYLYFFRNDPNAKLGEIQRIFACKIAEIGTIYPRFPNSGAVIWKNCMKHRLKEV